MTAKRRLTFLKNQEKLYASKNSRLKTAENGLLFRPDGVLAFLPLFFNSKRNYDYSSRTFFIQKK